MIPHGRQDGGAGASSSAASATAPTTGYAAPPHPHTLQHHPSPHAHTHPPIPQSSSTTATPAPAPQRMSWDNPFLDTSEVYVRDNAVALGYVAQAAATHAAHASQAQMTVAFQAAGISASASTTASAIPASRAPARPPSPLTKWHQELLTRVGGMPPQPNPGRSRPAQYKAYVAWGEAVARWHAELEAFCRRPPPPRPGSSLVPLPRLQNSPHLPSTAGDAGSATTSGTIPIATATRPTPIHNAAGPAFPPAPQHHHVPFSPAALEAYLVNELTPTYRRFRALADSEAGVVAQPGDSHDALLQQLESALEAVVHSRVLARIAPGGSPDIAAASFVQFAAHELLPSWERFRASVGGSPDELCRLSWGDEVVLALVASLETLRETPVACGCH